MSYMSWQTYIPTVLLLNVTPSSANYACYSFANTWQMQQRYVNLSIYNIVNETVATIWNYNSNI